VCTVVVWMSYVLVYDQWILTSITTEKPAHYLLNVFPMKISIPSCRHKLNTLKETWYGISGYSKFEHEMSSIPILRHRSYLPLNFSHFDRVNKSLFKKIWRLHMVLVRYFSHNFSNLSNLTMGPSLPWSYVSWIYNYLCNQCLSPLKLWVRIPLMPRCIRYNIMW
jgi:hypothetical protein